MSDISDRLGINVGFNQQTDLGNGDVAKFLKNYTPAGQLGLYGPNGGNAAINPDPNEVKYQQDKSALAAQEGGLADQFKANQPGLQNQLYSQIQGQAKQNIAQNQQNIRRSANSRGLLFSGLRQGEEANSNAQIASQAADQMSKVAPSLQNQYEAINAKAMALAQQNYHDDLATARATFDQALSQANLDANNMGNFIGGAGAVAGKYFASSNGAPQPQPVQMLGYPYSGADTEDPGILQSAYSGTLYG